MLVNAWSLQVHNVLLSLSNFCQCFFFFLHDQHYRMSVEWHILWRRSCLPLVKSLYTDSYKGGTVVFLMADIFLLTKIRKNDYLSFIRQNTVKFRKCPDAYICQRSFLRGLFLEGLMYARKFAFQNQLHQLTVGRKFTIFALFYLVFEGKSNF